MRPFFAIAALCACVALGFGQSDLGASLENYRKELEANPSSSLAHYRIAEIFFQQRNYQSAANEFREALNGDLQPGWIEVQAHLNLGTIFDLTGQSDRALNEYRLAQAINRNAATTSDNPLPPGTYRVGKGVVAPQPLLKTEPEYSEEARLAGLEGAVLLTGTITEQGVPRDMRVTRPLGFGLDEKALEAIQHWRFMPGTFQGQPVPVVTTVAVDFRLPEKQSRWHLIRVEFTPPAGASRPQFSKTIYPYGTGISTYASEEGLFIIAIGRQGTAKVSFDVDEHGSPVNFQVLSASHAIWGPEALAVVRDWQFIPGTKFGVPVAVPCTLDLVWGRANLSPQALEWAVAQMSTPSIPETLDAPTPAPADGAESSPAVAYKTDPSYTEEARKAGLEGTVVISLFIGEDGIPQDLRVTRRLGLGLDEKAIDAVSQWRFRPALRNGLPSRVPATIEVNFRLPR